MVNRTSNTRLASNYHAILQKLELSKEASVALSALASGTKPPETERHSYAIDKGSELTMIERRELGLMLNSICDKLNLDSRRDALIKIAHTGTPAEIRKELQELAIVHESANLLHSIYMAENSQLTATPLRTEEVFQQQLPNIERFQERQQEFRAMSKEARREVFANLVKFEETSKQILRIENAKRRSILQLRANPSRPIHPQFSDLTRKLSEMKRELALSDDEAIEFQAVSIDSKQAKRIHLIQIAEDYIAAFKKLMGDDHPQIAEWEKTIQGNPAIGAGNPSQPLSNDKKTWKEQQKAFEKALQPILNEMGAILESDGKSMKELNESRDAILRDSSRWQNPIIRQLSIPGTRNKMRHVLDAFNPGYPSSSFRGRKPGKDCIIPNAHAVTVQNPLGGLRIDYLSSATPVEFFADGDDRTNATRQQCLELMINGAIQKDKNISTLENPCRVEFTAVGLLTPDPFTRFINKRGKINHILGRIFKWMKPDPSIDETRILQDTATAFSHLQNEAPLGSSYSFQAKDGSEQTVTIVLGLGGERCFKLERKGKQPSYFTFDVTLFDFGVNKTKKALIALGSKSSIENDLNEPAWKKLKASAMREIGEIEFSPELESTRQEYLIAKRNRSGEKEALTKWIAAKDKEVAKLDTPEKKRAFDILCLMEEIDDQMEFKDYLTQFGMNRNAYSLPSAVVTLAALLNQAAWTGCRSGKDRTSLQRVEVATRMGMHAVRGRFLHYTEMEEDPNTYRVREEILFHSGHIDRDGIAGRNIGSQGLNLGGACAPYLQRRLATGERVVREDYTTTTGGAYKAFKRKVEKKL